ncbi:MAG: carotenoid oxygenase family protein [Kaiparowitsia implicata GSE-PSE-MK54-09C]|jgi:all-trans-8'-apo-beta-carotenal 15,15'-oxygenase|nr:carotenoid oxygenase family protein [Kaiparowitsia implicata GSE-PSE-MK54-09C]
MQTQQSPTAQSYTVEDWRKGYKSLYDEFDYAITDSEGQIPPDLQGTLFRNGPGLLDVGGDRIQHPFDGDGMVCAVSFKNGQARFRNRFVRTEGYVAEQQAQKLLYRGVFGTQKPGGWLANAFDFRLKNIANTNVIYWGGKLLALWEAAEPYRLDPQTLETIGLDYLGGVLQPGDAFAAHPWVDPDCNGEPRLVNFAIKPGLSTTITLYEFDVAGSLVQQHSHSVPGFAFIHDFAITPHYCIFFQNPVQFNPVPFALGLRGAGECITFRHDQPTQVVIIPRDPAGTMQVIPAESGFVFHHANAYEQGETLVVDSIAYDALPAVESEQDFRQVVFESLAPGQLWRLRVDLNTQTVERSPLELRCCEFPVVHPNRVGREYSTIYAAAAHQPSGNAPHQAILKANVETGDRQLWSAAPWGYVSEPVFVPRPTAEPDAEDDGWLLTLVFNAHTERSEVVILNAATMALEARLKLQHHVPYGLHGSFAFEI